MSCENISFEFDRLVPLVRRRITDPAVQAYFGGSIERLERDEFYGSITFPSDGMEAVFQEAPWVLPKEEVEAPEELVLAAFLLNREGHEDYAQYRGKLPGGIEFRNSMEEIQAKLGSPERIGGGDGWIALLEKPAPKWFKYPLSAGVEMHPEFDTAERLEMVAVQTPNKRPSSSGGDADAGGS